MVCKCYHADKNFLGEIGVCWGTKERESCSCRGDEAKCDFYDYVRERVKKPITNADRIRAMTDEELAEFMTKGCDNRECPDISFPADTPFAKDASNEQCRKCWLDWLKQEVEE